jgi:hypothetical protein
MMCIQNPNIYIIISEIKKNWKKIEKKLRNIENIEKGVISISIFLNIRKSQKKYSKKPLAEQVEATEVNTKYIDVALFVLLS